MYVFSIFFNMKVYCVFSLELPHQGDSNEYVQYSIFNIPYKFYVLGQIGLSKQCRPRSDCF